MTKYLLTNLIVGILFLLVAAPVSSANENLVGTWNGNLEVSETELPLVLNVSFLSKSYNVTLDSPDQNAFGIPVEHFVVVNEAVNFSVPSVGGRYSGNISQGYDQMSGIWRQPGFEGNLVFRKEEKGKRASKVRPQEPRKPYPYESRQVLFSSGESGKFLSGTVTIPPGPGPHPGVVLVSGSGPQDRDSLVYGHRPFLVIADYLTRKGYAVLRYDDRGVGLSEGDFETATTHDAAKDAYNALAYLESQEVIDPDDLHLIGMSEGGIISVLAAVQGAPVSKLVLISTPIVSFREVLLDQVRSYSVASGDSPELTEQKVNLQESILALLMDHSLTKEEKMSAVEGVLIKAGVSKQAAREQSRLVTTPWFLGLLELDVQGQLARLDTPVLAIWGGKDIQVLAQKNASALKELKHPQIFTEIFPNMNHLMQPADKGTIVEYYQIQTTFSLLVLDFIIDWVNLELENN